MLPSSSEDDWYQNQPDPSTARKDTGARNPGIRGFRAPQNFLSRARIGPSDSSKCSPAQAKRLVAKSARSRHGSQRYSHVTYPLNQL
ncbi:hypothetical protein DdX_08085 [Ditylenchus destructor]|uniref:Uncharacterized protein n=1 Tax=Ditylenchus destructor TaxID=166010 RepID=A0AAD4N2V2_9BILA|nr:hypothetical protein DdX_08085 [Ditylenchus destructor]